MQKYLAELLGVAGIVAAVLGAGYMVTNLGAQGGVGLALIAVSVAAALLIGITVLGPVSGAHLNPAVTIAFWIQKGISAKDAIGYIGAQLVGGVIGAVTANLMFEKAVVSVNDTVRAGTGQLIGEVVATTGLVLSVLILVHIKQGMWIAPAVAVWVLGGHFFTSSTSFANPAVTFGRAFSDSLTGIEWGSVAGFVVAELAAAVLAVLLFKVLYPTKK